ncbi:outer membrane lipoprotein carrier protein LolA [Sphingomonas sp. SUN039]|nr:outer membrane lipoprotein carrier protein LolA [Sphingomonas sp. SUN039]UVO55946.1 outer membrane lipoprotein carrier protein LolA [Sphingomonas sp. SUN039]
MALSLLASPTFAQPVSPQLTDLAAVQTHLRAVTTMTADFAQTDRSGKTLTGRMTMKRPGKVRFQYQEGVPILIVADGSSLWFIDYQVRQVQRWPIGNSPLAALLDPAKDITRFARVVPVPDARVLFVEARDPRHPEYGTLTLAFARESGAPAGLRLQGWIALDGQNNRTSVRLSNQRFNVGVGDEAFRWRDPRPMRGPK